MAATASAAPAGASSVEETIYDLRTQGYTVQLNGTRNGPLSNCSVDSVRGASDGGGSGCDGLRRPVLPRRVPVLITAGFARAAHPVSGTATSLRRRNGNVHGGS